MRIKYILYAFLTSSLVMSCCIIFLAIQLKISLLEISKVQERRFQSIQLSDQLLQSSNNLTNLARIFAQTGEAKFKEYFFYVIDIRSGKRDRPIDYGRAFWDFVLAGEVELLEQSSQIRASIEDLMVQLRFSPEEFDYLKKSKNLSDQLAQIENRVFNLIQGLYPDENGNYTKKGPKDVTLAKQLLHSQEYFDAKAAIMQPIKDFYQHVDERTRNELTIVQNKAWLQLILILVSTGILLFLLFTLFLVIYKKVLLRIDKLVDVSLRITKGDLSGRSQITGRDELGILGRAFDKMVSQLADTLAIVTATKSRMESELNVAKDIQMSMVPLTFPAYPEHAGFDIFAQLVPAREVGGDFYDFYFVDKDHLCFVVGDVSGKGVPAALMMAVCRTLLKVRAQDDSSPASVTTHVNDEIAKENPNCMFVTVFIGILNISTGSLTYTNAGHNPALIKNKDGEVGTFSKVHGPVVGAMEDFAYEESHVNLKAGDTLLLYTDGVTEAHNPQDEMYSEGRLVQFVKGHELTSSQHFMDDLYRDLRNFEDGREPFDDTTALCLRYIKNSEDTPRAIKTVEIKNEMKQINTVINEFEVFAQEYSVPGEVVMKMGLVFDDILSNVIQYAYTDEAEHIILIYFKLYSDQILITVADDGIPFNPLLIKSPDINLSIEERVLGGLGIHLVKNIVDDCHYRRRVDQNILTLIKKL